MVKVVAVANQKGGVAKTTTVQSLGVAMAQAGHRVLAVDLDPQACLTFSCGLNPDELDASLHDVMVRRAKLSDVLLPVVGTDGLDLVPATIDLAGAEVHLLSRTGREHVLARALLPVIEGYDAVLIDCPPSLGVLPTMFDARTTHSRQVLAEVGERYGLPLFGPPVPKSVRFAEAPGLGKSVLQHAPNSPGAMAYRTLSTTVYDAMQSA